MYESLELEQESLQEVEAQTSDRCVFATNTGAILAPSRPPGPKVMRPENTLLEIIPHVGTLDEALVTAFIVGTMQGKTGVVLKDVPGFYVNRCLGLILAELSALVKEGVSLENSECLCVGVFSSSDLFSDPCLPSRHLQCRSDPSPSWTRSELTWRPRCPATSPPRTLAPV